MATINGTAGNDSLTGTSGDDTINGLAGNDTINALAGNDRLDGGAGTDSLNGGAGNDTYIVTSGDVLSDSGGVDTVVSDVSWTLGAGFENLTMTGTAAINVTGNELGNFAIGNSAANYFNLRAGNDTIQAGGGNDRIDLSNFGTPSYGDDVIDGGAGFDTISFTTASGQKSAVVVDLAAGTARGGGEGGIGSATLTGVEGVIGAAFADRLSGSAVAESFEGREGNDTLSGLGGNDTLIGGTGQDTFVFASAPGSGNVDQVTDFAPGTDRLAFENAVFTGLGSAGNFTAGDARFAAGAGFTSGRDASDRIVYNTTNGQLFYDADGSGTGSAQLVATLQGVPALSATDIAVIGQAAPPPPPPPPPGPIQGTAGNDSLTGTEGNDSINGLAGNDTIDGRAGHDTIDGGDGNDHLTAGHGTDIVRGGNGNDTLASADFADDGNPRDTLDGGLGNDTYDLRADPFSDLHESVLVDAGGSDTVLSNHNFTLPGGIENLTLFQGHSGIGNELDNVITTRSNEPHSYFIDGAGGHDTLIGGTDPDTMRGGSGSDVFVFSQPSAQFFMGDNVQDFASGTDDLHFDNRGFANLGEPGQLSSGDARFFAGAGATSGQDASDRLIYDTSTGGLHYDGDGSGPGESQLIVTLQGAPTLVATDITVIGEAAPPASPAQGTSGNDSLTGTEGNDSISGLAGSDTINALGGDDTLDGGAGIDTLNGGAGNDRYIVTSGDVLSDSGGVDTVVGDVSWTLGAGFENLTMTGTAGISVTGNELGNFAIGNSGANYFNPRAGNDTIQAGGGNDRIDLSNFGTPSYGDDVIDGGAGFDTISFTTASGQKSAVVVDLAAGTARGGGEGGIGSATLTGVEGVIGAAFADRLSGSAVAESFEGREGNDTLSGLGGNDTLIGGTGQDMFVFAAAPGSGNVDQVSDFAPAIDKLAFENAVFTGLGSAGNFTAGDARFAAGAGFASGRDSSDRIVYNTTNGQLFYDADGSGAGASQLIATLQGAPALVATDITVTGQAAPPPPPPSGTIRGTGGNDSLTGTAGNDSMEGLGGNDTIDGRAGNDTLDGGDGDDRLVISIGHGGTGTDWLRGGSGNDTLINSDNVDPENPPDTLDGGLGNDTYHLGGSSFGDLPASVLVDAGGVDTIVSNHDFVLPDGFENLTLFEGFNGTGNGLNNVITTHSNEPRGYFIDGAGGNDTLIGGTVHDAMRGGAGNDAFVFTQASPFEVGDDVQDFASGTDDLHFDNRGFVNLGGAGQLSPGDARFFAGAGATSGQDASDRLIYDTSTGVLHYDGDGSGPGESQSIVWLQGAPTLVATDITVIGEAAPPPPAPPPGGQGINGTAGNDSLTGTAGDDMLQGLAGNDTLNGLAGNDTLLGGDGKDQLEGRNGNDSLTGGAAADLFMFLQAPAAGGVDRITDLASGTDEVVFENAVFTGLGASGAFASGDARFRSGAGITTGQDSTDRLIYNTSTGSLYYDADGSGSGASQLVATFAGNPGLAATDIWVM